MKYVTWLAYGRPHTLLPIGTGISKPQAPIWLGKLRSIIIFEYFIFNLSSWGYFYLPWAKHFSGFYFWYKARRHGRTLIQSNDLIKGVLDIFSCTVTCVDSCQWRHGDQCGGCWGDHGWPHLHWGCPASSPPVLGLVVFCLTSSTLTFEKKIF